MFLAPDTAFVRDSVEWDWTVEVDMTDRVTNPDGSYRYMTHTFVIRADCEADAALWAVDWADSLWAHQDGMFLAARVVDCAEPGA